MIQGDENAIWGFLEDIWFWQNGKISPNDPAAQLSNRASKSSLNLKPK